MKKYIAFIILVVFVSSCSVSFSDIPKSRSEYIKKILVCDSKTTDFKIVNQEDLAEFFNNEDLDVVSLEYEYSKAEKVKLKRDVTIRRIVAEGKIYYTADFQRNTFPFSYCRKLKTEPKYFK